MNVAFSIGTAAAYFALVAFVALTRGRLYATFVGVVLGVHTLVSVALAPRFGVLTPLALYFQATVFVHFALLVRSKLRGIVYRSFVSIPASAFAAGTFLAFPWAIAAAFGYAAPGIFVPFAAAGVGVVQSLFSFRKTVALTIDHGPRGDLARAPRGDRRVARPLRVVQITDPHLGPFMSEARLRRIVERAVGAKPDLVLLTGDLLTMEAHHAPAALARALSPLSEMEGKVFACRGNHDFEAIDTIATALAAAGVRYLIDDACTVETEAGMVQIVGLDFTRRDRAARMAKVLAAHPREPGQLRLVMLHDPGAFRHLADGEADLVLSGHTHGGQVGVVSLGLPWTLVSLFTKIPDHGFWAQGTNRLYVHRGTGHYGFPLRVGVPSEEGVLEIHVLGDRNEAGE